MNSLQLVINCWLIGDPQRGKIFCTVNLQRAVVDSNGNFFAGNHSVCVACFTGHVIYMYM